MIGDMEPPAGPPATPGEVVRRVRIVSGVPWRRLFGYLRPHLAQFSLALVGLVLGSGLALLVPLVVAGLVTEVVAGGDSAALDALIVGLVVLFLAQSLGGFVQSYFLGVVGERIVAQMRGELFARLVTLSLDFHAGSRVGELVSRLSSDVTLVRTMLTQTTTSLLSSVIGLVGSVVILFLLSPTLLLVAVLLAPALIAVAIVFGRPLQRVSTEVQDAIARSTGTAEEALGGIRVVKSYVREDFEVERYGADLSGVVAKGTRLALWRASFGALMGFLGFGAVIVLLWYTGHQVIDGNLGIGTLTGFLLYGITIGGSLASIAGLYGQFREGTGAVTRVFEILDTEPTIRDAPDAVDARGRVRRHRDRRRLVRLRRRQRGPAERQARRPARRDPGPGGSVGLREDDARQPAATPLGRHVGRDPARWPRRAQADDREPPGADRPRGPGGGPVRRHRARQHPVRASRRHGCRDRGGGPRGQRA